MSVSRNFIFIPGHFIPVYSYGYEKSHIMLIARHSIPQVIIEMRWLILCQFQKLFMTASDDMSQIWKIKSLKRQQALNLTDNVQCHEIAWCHRKREGARNSGIAMLVFAYDTADLEKTLRENNT